MSGPVGIVLVSHSPRLAAGLAELLEQLTAGAVPVRSAGGTDDGRLGTSYALVRQAITAADRRAGVVVIPDLGSSVLLARTVLEDHPDPSVVVIDTPFVEGAIALAAVAAGGADLATVVQAGEEARHIRKF